METESGEGGRRKRRVYDGLLQLGLGLLLGSAPDLGHRRVGAAVEDVLAVHGALPERGPTLGVVVVHVVGVDGGSSDVVLERSKVGEDLGDSRRSVFVH